MCHLLEKTVALAKFRALAPPPMEVSAVLPPPPRVRDTVAMLHQDLCDADTEIYEVVHPLHRGPVDPEGIVIPLLLPPKVHHQLLSLAFTVRLFSWNQFSMWVTSSR